MKKLLAILLCAGMLLASSCDTDSSNSSSPTQSVGHVSSEEVISELNSSDVTTSDSSSSEVSSEPVSSEVSSENSSETSSEASSEASSDPVSSEASSEPEPEPGAPTPIVIIPGIIGSELVNAQGRVVWPIDSAVLEGGDMAAMLAAVTDFLSIKLDANGEDTAGLTPVRVSPMTEYSEGDNVGAQGFYNELAIALSEEYGYENVYFFGYDWRLSNLHTAEELDGYIDRVLDETDADKVNIVAHSMGGLVTGAYLSKYGEGLLERVVTCGTPFLGAWDAYTTLENGGGFFDFSENPQLQQFSAVFLDVFSSITSLYELLPAEAWEALGLTQNSTLKESATAAQRQAYGYYTSVTCNLESVWENVNHINIVGKGFDTNGINGPEDGDGTVSYYSATLDGGFIRNKKEFNLNHTGIVTDEGAIEAIADSLAA